MVLEQMFKAQWLEKRPWHAFLLGAIYSIVGIISARLIFGSNPGMMTVAFTSILLIPSLNRLLKDEENVEIREKKFSMKLLFKDHKDIFEIYIFLFLGIFFTFALTSILLPQQSVQHLFGPQLQVIGITGEATTSIFGYAVNNSALISIIMNNLLVLIVCLILSLVYGAGSILFITWNATVWGVVFGFMMKDAALAQSQNPFLYFAISFLPFFPHMITEAISYFSAAIVGGVVSKAVLREKVGSTKFHHIMTDAYILLAIGLGIVIIAGIIEVQLYPILAGWVG